jgi:hypothetical protein
MIMLTLSDCKNFRPFPHVVVYPEDELKANSIADNNHASRLVEEQLEEP